MKLIVNIEKRYFFGILVVMLVVAGIFAVWASHTTNPSVSHNVNQITGIPTCSSGEVLTHTSSGIVCVNDRVGGAEDSGNFLAIDDDFASSTISIEPEHFGLTDEDFFLTGPSGYMYASSIQEAEFIVKVKSKTGNPAGDHPVFGFYYGTNIGDAVAASGGRFIGFQTNPATAPNGNTATNWVTVTKESGGSANSKPTTVQVPSENSAPQWYNLKIVRVDANTIDFYINEIKVNTHTSIPAGPVNVGLFEADYIDYYKIKAIVTR